MQVKQFLDFVKPDKTGRITFTEKAICFDGSYMSGKTYAGAVPFHAEYASSLGDALVAPVFLEGLKDVLTVLRSAPKDAEIKLSVDHLDCATPTAILTAGEYRYKWTYSKDREPTNFVEHPKADTVEVTCNPLELLPALNAVADLRAQETNHSSTAGINVYYNKHAAGPVVFPGVALMGTDGRILGVTPVEAKITPKAEYWCGCIPDCFVQWLQSMGSPDKVALTWVGDKVNLAWGDLSAQSEQFGVPPDYSVVIDENETTQVVFTLGAISKKDMSNLCKRVRAAVVSGNFRKNVTGVDGIAFRFWRKADGGLAAEAWVGSEEDAESKTAADRIYLPIMVNTLLQEECYFSVGVNLLEQVVQERETRWTLRGGQHDLIRDERKDADPLRKVSIPMVVLTLPDADGGVVQRKVRLITRPCLIEGDFPEKFLLAPIGLKP